MTEESPMPAAEPMSQEIINRLKEADEATLRRSIKAAKGQAVPIPDGLAKPCPWCGKGAEIQPWHGGGPDKHFIGCIGSDDDDPYCEVCPQVTGETLQEALDHWNTRNLTPSGVERIRAEAFEEAAKVAADIRTGVSGEYGLGFDRAAEDIASAIRALALPSEPPSQGDVEGRQCTIPPAGWWCSREAGHEGPCAARPSSDTHRGWEIRQGRWPEPAWMATGPNYDASYEGPEDGWVDNGQKADAPTREALVEEIDAWIEAHEDDKSCHPSKEDGRS